MVTPYNWTSLLLEWSSPNCSYYFACEFVESNFTYNVTLTTPDGYINEFESFSNWTIINLGGYECEEVTIEISMPGNCKPAKISAILLQGMLLQLFVYKYKNHFMK